MLAVAIGLPAVAGELPAIVIAVSGAIFSSEVVTDGLEVAIGALPLVAFSLSTVVVVSRVTVLVF